MKALLADSRWLAGVAVTTVAVEHAIRIRRLRLALPFPHGEMRSTSTPGRLPPRATDKQKLPMSVPTSSSWASPGDSSLRSE